jgi:hypothetical protein
MKKIVAAVLFTVVLGTGLAAVWGSHSLAQTGVGSSGSAPKDPP